MLNNVLKYLQYCCPPYPFRKSLYYQIIRIFVPVGEVNQAVVGCWTVRCKGEGNYGRRYVLCLTPTSWKQRSTVVNMWHSVDSTHAVLCSVRSLTNVKW